MACQCMTGPDGRVTVCDSCAAGMIEAINDLLPGDRFAADLPQVLTPSEFAGLTNLVNGWLDGLQSQKEAR